MSAPRRFLESAGHHDRKTRGTQDRSGARPFRVRQSESAERGVALKVLVFAELIGALSHPAPQVQRLLDLADRMRQTEG